MTTRALWVGFALSLLGAISMGACSDDGADATASQPSDVLPGQPGSPAPGTADPSQASANNTDTAVAGMPASQAMPPQESVPETPAAGAGAETPPAMQPSEPADPTQEQPAEPDPMVEVPPAMPSSGCGASDWPQSGEYTIDVDGTQREYIVKLPDTYDPDTPYRLVFVWHGRGGSAQQVAGGFFGGYYGLEMQAAGNAIFVAGQGLTSGGSTGWPNTGGQDIAFVRAMLDSFRGSYCIDEERIFATGISFGAFMTTTIGCQLGDVVRAIAPMSGGGNAFFGPPCVGQVAAWISHGNQDTVVAFQTGEANRDHWLMANHCGSDVAPTEPAPCLQYAGCDEGYPVHFCEFDGGHTIPAFAAEGIWNFFAQF